MLAALVALGWPAAGGITPFSGAFWIQQAISAVGSLIFLRWVARLAAGDPRTIQPRSSRSRGADCQNYVARRRG